jgi:hypothetical protein
VAGKRAAERVLAQVAVSGLELVQLEPELERGLVEALELELGRDLVVLVLALDRAAEELELAPAAADRVLAQVAAVLRTKSVTAAHRPDLAPLLAAEDLAAAAAETTREPVAAEAVIAWEVADLAAVAEDVAAEDAAAEEDAEDKRAVDEEKTNENKNKYYDFAENSSDRFCDPYFLFVKPRGAGGATGQNGCACDIAANPKRIRHTETGSRCPYSGSGEF